MEVQQILSLNLLMGIFWIFRSCDQNGGRSSIYTGRYLCARISVLMASCEALLFLVHTDIFNTLLKIL